MKYAFTIYGDESQRESATPEQMQQMSQAYCERHTGDGSEGRARGRRRPLPDDRRRRPSACARRADVIDGPFAETKEQLGGFYVLDVKDLDEAIEWAAKIPTAAVRLDRDPAGAGLR